MTFKSATDRLGLTAEELASELRKDLGISVSAQWVRQARLDPDRAGHRSPPAGWEAVAARLARERGAELQDLADELG